jgi:hypothetical protein
MLAADLRYCSLLSTFLSATFNGFESVTEKVCHFLNGGNFA